MKKPTVHFKKKIWLLFFLLCLFLLTPASLWAINQQECRQRLEQDGEVNWTEGELEECLEIFDQLRIQAAKEKKSLENEIVRFNNQISYTNAQILKNQRQIEVLEKEIKVLGERVDILDHTLDEISALLLKRIEETYKHGKMDLFLILFSSQNFSQFIDRFKYFQAVQVHDKQLLYQIEKTKANYAKQKDLKEEKQEEIQNLKISLEEEKRNLAQQKKSKQYLLQVTKNNEATYQRLLAAAQAEIEAIRAIIQGKGDEAGAGEVEKGDKIATIISGSSCNSRGTHLHFMITDQGGATKNPFAYLKTVSHKNCSGSSCGSSDGDSFNPTGSWDWPVDPPVVLTQGYGNTWAVKYDPFVSQIYDFHNGIDFTGSSLTVKAVQPGTLYRGSYTGSNGCRLPYVKIKHKDSELMTYYLHVNY